MGNELRCCTSRSLLNLRWPTLTRARRNLKKTQQRIGLSIVLTRPWWLNAQGRPTIFLGSKSQQKVPYPSGCAFETLVMGSGNQGTCKQVTSSANRPRAHKVFPEAEFPKARVLFSSTRPLPSSHFLQRVGAVAAEPVACLSPSAPGTASPRTLSPEPVTRAERRKPPA